MLDKKKVAFFSFLFFLAFTIIGDAYIYFLDGKIDESDFKYTTSFKDDELGREYLNDLEKLSEELHLKIYVINSTVNSKNSSTYTVYSTDNNKDYVKSRILVQNDVSTFSSLINGRREVIFKPLGDAKLANKEVYYNVFGTKENVEVLRSKTIDKYGMSKPIENLYPNDATFMIASAWIIVFFTILLYVAIEVNNLKKEVLIKYFNGSDKKDIILPLILNNSVTIFISTVIGILLAQLITESFKFLIISLILVLIIILSTNLLYLKLRNLNIKKTFVKSYYTSGYKLLTFATLFIITITLILTLTLNIKTIYDAMLTINQEDKWEEFHAYDNVLFMFRHFTDTTNIETDAEHAVNFYNDYLDTYQIHLSFDFINNGGIASSMTDVNETFIYLNKYAKKNIEHLNVDLDKLVEDRYYIISRYSDEELEEKGIFDLAEPNEITDLLGENRGVFETIYIKDPYKLLVYDINITNLADNYKKNPIIILDTHDKLPGNPIYDSLSVHNGAYVFNSLIKFQNDNDFEEYIKKIGYENEIFYKNNVKDLYLEKRAEKMLILLINVILSLMILVLFNISLSTILKNDFNSRAVEVALDKVFGKTLFERYKGLFRLLIGAFGLGIIIALLCKLIFYQFSFIFILVSAIIVFINTIFTVYLYINKYEKIGIPRILKGGV